LVYPTTRQLPALLGETPASISCALAAHSGFPALAMPAGFTAAGVPVGLELLGKPFSDARLVSLGFAFEQSGSRRMPPPTTPPLARTAMTVEEVATHVTAENATARALFTFDYGRSAVAWEVEVTGVPAEQLLGVYLQRVDSAMNRMVVHRLVAPGSLRGAGRGLLRAREREALLEGRLSVRLLTRGRPDGAEAVVALR
jgi:hypothetical protein